MRYGVRFEEAWALLVPLIDLNRNVLFEKRTRFGGGPTVQTIFSPDRFQHPVDRSRRDPE